MSKVRANDPLLTECGPYFLQGLEVVAEFARRTRELVREAVEQQSLTEAFGFGKNETDLTEYWYPDKLQKTKPGDEVLIGVKIKSGDAMQCAIYRYWEMGDDGLDHGLCSWLWIKNRAKLAHLAREMSGVFATLPDPARKCVQEEGEDGSWYLWRKLDDSEIQAPDILSEFVVHYKDLLAKLGGVKKFLA
jgi:hypothetical protein